MIFEDQNIFRERNLRDILNMMWGAHTHQAKQTPSAAGSSPKISKQMKNVNAEINKMNIKEEKDGQIMTDICIDQNIKNPIIIKNFHDDHIGYIHQIGYRVACEENPLQITKEQEKKKMFD